MSRLSWRRGFERRSGARARSRSRSSVATLLMRDSGPKRPRVRRPRPISPSVSLARVRFQSLLRLSNFGANSAATPRCRARCALIEVDRRRRGPTIAPQLRAACAASCGGLRLRRARRRADRLPACAGDRERRAARKRKGAHGDLERVQRGDARRGGRQCVSAG